MHPCRIALLVPVMMGPKPGMPATPMSWLVTGAAGFIGSHLVEALLAGGQHVVGMDNFATGTWTNLEDVQRQVGDEAWRNLRFLESDIRDLDACRRACLGVDFVLHQAALGSVPRSIHDPMSTHRTNVDGFLNVLQAAREAGVARMVFASSSSVYGDHPDLPKREDRLGDPLSPYALTKRIDEDYAAVYSRVYGFHTLGLRYFNVFGPRQNIHGPYAAVIPRWITSLLAGEPCTIHGDGRTARDFTFVTDVVRANIQAALSVEILDRFHPLNIARGRQSDLSALYEAIRLEVGRHRPSIQGLEPVHVPFRAGDVQCSLADITEARRRISYEPAIDLQEGIQATVAWYLSCEG